MIHSTNELSSSDSSSDFNIESLMSIQYRIPQSEREYDTQFLNGRTMTVTEIVPENPVLRQNLELSKKIIDFVHTYILFSENYPNREGSKRIEMSDLDLEIAYEIIRDETISVEEGINRSVQYQMGNCHEMAFLGLSCPDIQSTKVEPFDIQAGDHVFLLVGGNSNSSEVFWNKETVICDPWSNAYYPILKSINHLKKCIGLISLDDFPSPPFVEVSDISGSDVICLNAHYSSYNPSLVNYQNSTPSQ